MSVARACGMAWIVATAAGCVVMPTGAYYRAIYPFNC